MLRFSAPNPAAYYKNSKLAMRIFNMMKAIGVKPIEVRDETGITDSFLSVNGKKTHQKVMLVEGELYKVSCHKRHANTNGFIGFTKITPEEAEVLKAAESF
jgi:hypothetical protein